MKEYLTIDEARAALSRASALPITDRDITDFAMKGMLTPCVLIQVLGIEGRELKNFRFCGYVSWSVARHGLNDFWIRNVRFREFETFSREPELLIEDGEEVDPVVLDFVFTVSLRDDFLLEVHSGKFLDQIDYGRVHRSNVVFPAKEVGALCASTEAANKPSAPNKPSERLEQTLLNTIGALITLMLERTLTHKTRSGFETQEAIVEGLVARYPAVRGMGDSNLQKIFADARKSLKSTETGAG